MVKASDIDAQLDCIRDTVKARLCETFRDDDVEEFVAKMQKMLDDLVDTVRTEKDPETKKFRREKLLLISDILGYILHPEDIPFFDIELLVKDVVHACDYDDF